VGWGKKSPIATEVARSIVLCALCASAVNPSAEDAEDAEEARRVAEGWRNLVLSLYY
jgi:hypothetical protein